MMKKITRNREQGFTIVEMLVSIVLLAIVAVGVTAVILSITSTAQKFTASVTTQNTAADAVAAIGRDISASTKITEADDWHLSMETVQDGKKQNVSIFYWSPNDASQVPNGVPTENLPDNEAILEYRADTNGTANSGHVITLTEGYEKARQAKTLFTYFDANNKSITTPVTETDSLDKIKRVEYQFSLKIADRNALIELASSATPRSLADIKNGGVLAENETCLPPVLSGTIPAGSTAATLNWNEITQASNGYTLYRSNPKESTKDIAVATIGDRTVNTHVDSNNDSGLKWGEQYVYTVVANCGTTVSKRSNQLILYVVPDKPEIINLNVNKNLGDVLTTATETGTRSTSAATVGKKYSVARDLTNQVVWLPENGATSYKVYRDGLFLAATPDTTYLDTATYGDDYNYQISAVGQPCPGIAGCGGEGAKSVQEQLISPPIASEIQKPTNVLFPNDASKNNALTAKDPVRPDTSARDTTTDNNIRVVKLAPYTNGFRTSRVTTTAADVNCTLASRYGPMDFTTTYNAAAKTYTVTAAAGKLDSTVEWGSTTCYSLTPYNAAGEGVAAEVKVNQYPGRFGITGAGSSTYQHINESAGLPGGAQCWVSNNGATYTPCNSGAGLSSGNRYAIGLFGSVNNQKANLNLVWGQSLNAFNGYKINKTRTETGGITDQGSVSSTNSAVYVNGSQSSRFLNEMPGSAFTMNVVASAANNAARTASSENIVTSPDIPGKLESVIQTKGGADTFRTKTIVGTYVNRGKATNVVAVSNPGNVTGTYAATGGTQDVYSSGYNGGDRGSYAYTTLNLKGANAVSATVGRSGTTTPGCNSRTLSCGANYADTPEVYPLYYAGAHYRYEAGGTAAASVDGGQGNTSAINPPSTPSAPPASVGTDGAEFSCDKITPSNPDWDTFSCIPNPKVTAPTLKTANVDNDVSLGLTYSDVVASDVYDVKIEGTNSKGAVVKTLVLTPATNPRTIDHADIFLKPKTTVKVTVTGRVVNPGSTVPPTATYTLTLPDFVIAANPTPGVTITKNTQNPANAAEYRPLLGFTNLVNGGVYNVEFIGTQNDVTVTTKATFTATGTTMTNQNFNQYFKAGVPLQVNVVGPTNLPGGQKTGTITKSPF